MGPAVGICSMSDARDTVWYPDYSSLHYFYYNRRYNKKKHDGIVAPDIVQTVEYIYLVLLH